MVFKQINKINKHTGVEIKNGRRKQDKRAGSNNEDTTGAAAACIEKQCCIPFSIHPAGGWKEKVNRSNKQCFKRA